MTTQTQARDAIADTINSAWLASGVTSAYELQWDNVKADPPGEDSAGNALPWGRVTVRHLISPQETIGGPECSKFLTEGLVTVQVFTPSGDGHVLGDQIVEVLKAALRNVSVGNLWFFDVRVNEIGQDGPWFNQNVVAGFRYQEPS
jgi:hypothetical protein